jgi:hypothetical protein
MAHPEWYKHRDAWRVHYRDRSGRLRYVRAAHTDEQQWEVRLFDSQLREISSDRLCVKQLGAKGLPAELRTWVNRRAANGRAA